MKVQGVQKLDLAGAGIRVGMGHTTCRNSPSHSHHAVQLYTPLSPTHTHTHTCPLHAGFIPQLLGPLT